MKLIYFSSQTMPKQHGGGKAAKVSFGKSGTISFNAPACALIGLKAGEKVTLTQDEEEPGNWYFFKDSQHGFEVRAGYDNKGCLFNHSAMVTAFINAIGFDENVTNTFLIAGQATTIKGDNKKTQYWGILIPQ